MMRAGDEYEGSCVGALIPSTGTGAPPPSSRSMTCIRALYVVDAVCFFSCVPGNWGRTHSVQ